MSAKSRGNCHIFVNDVFEDLIDENRRLTKELIFMSKCLNHLIEFKSLVWPSFSVRFDPNRLKRIRQLSQTIDDLLANDLRHYSHISDKVDQLFDSSSAERDNTKTDSQEVVIIPDSSDNEDTNAINGSEGLSNKQIKPLSQRLSSLLMPNQSEVEECNDEYIHEESFDMNSDESVDNSKSSDPNEPTFKCPVDTCGQSFVGRRALNDHLIEDHEDVSRLCAYDHCDSVFTSDTDLLKHESDYHTKPGQELCCDWAQCRFRGSKSALIAHRMSHTEGNRHVTNNPIKDFDGSSDTDDSSETSFDIDINDDMDVSDEESSVNKHNDCKPSSSRSYILVDPSSNQLKFSGTNNKVEDEEVVIDKKQMKVTNDKSIDKKNDSKQKLMGFKCTIENCDLIFPQISEVNDHVKQVHSESNITIKIGNKQMLFVCPVKNCGQSAIQMVELKDHIKKVHSKSFIPCVVEECLRVFKSESEREKHMSYPHKSTKTQILACDWPGCQFRAGKTKLAAHKYMHKRASMPDINCPVESCDQTFVGITAMKDHIKEVHSESYIACANKDCYKVFANETEMKRHIVYSHLRDRLYPCDWPGCQFEAGKMKMAMHRLAHENPSYGSASKVPIQKNSNGMLVCPFKDCYRSFVGRMQLNDHLSKSHSGIRIECPYESCQQLVFRSKHGLQNHVTKLHSDRTLTCDWPECQFTGDKMQVKVHKMSHQDNPNEFRCCQLTFRTYQQLKYHRMFHLFDESECTHEGCGRRFKHLVQLKYHFRTRHPQSKFKLKCNRIGCQHICGEDEIRQHHRWHRDEDKRLKEEKKKNQWVLCPWPGCDFKTNNHHYMTIHEQKHTGYKFKCSWSGCNVQFPTKSALKQHVERTHEKNKKFVCQEPGCGFRSAYKYALFYHSKNHLPESSKEAAKIRCDWPGCEYAVFRHSLMIKHRRTHQRVSPLRCPHSGCDFQTMIDQNLQRHIQTHATERNCICDQCGKRYKTNACLYQHKKVVHKKIRQIKNKQC